MKEKSVCTGCSTSFVELHCSLSGWVTELRNNDIIIKKCPCSSCLVNVMCCSTCLPLAKHIDYISNLICKVRGIFE